MSITLAPCPKAQSHELDKALPPEATLARVHTRLAALGMDILARTDRIDVGRLGIPVYLSVCGADAKRIMPTRKQMGKGASVAQAEASALMELMERFAFFSFWQRRDGFIPCTWSEAETRFGAELMPIEDIVRSVNDSLPAESARRLLDLLTWDFYPATRLTDLATVWVPLNWFRKLGEFNGTSAGNTTEESLLQGLCELVERHVCCHIDQSTPTLPTIDPASVNDPVLTGLIAAFEREGITLLLKDFSLDMPVPTVGAIAWDTATFPQTSEIVFTAGSAASPAKAAVRAVTEVAQLAGDFCTSACYEASALTKYDSLAQAEWLMQGPTVPLDSLPSVHAPDICDELRACINGLAARGFIPYALATTHPRIQEHTHYCFVPGLAFRERDTNQSVGLFVGRLLAEEADAHSAEHGLRVLAQCCPDAHYVPFFQGIFAMRQGDTDTARRCFAQAEPLQPNADARGLAAFYTAYAYTMAGAWAAALPALSRALDYCPDVKEYWNLRGVAYFKTAQYAAAAKDFKAALRLDKGSVMDLANLGLCEKMLGNTDAARHCLSAALNIDPTLDWARTHLDELAG